jgi:hypothetical protein
VISAPYALARVAVQRARELAALPTALLFLIHPSDPWPLPGHPEAMKMEASPRLYSHQCLEGEFLELRHDGVLRSSLLLGMCEVYSAISSRSSTTRHRGGLACLPKGGRRMYIRERLPKGKAEQERRAHQAARRAEEVWSASSSQMRRAERAPSEAVYRAEMLKWRIEGGGLRPRRPRSLELGGARRRRKPFQTKGLAK